MPATIERTPQRIGGRRFVLTQKRRTALIAAEVTGHAQSFTLTAAASLKVTPGQYVDKLAEHLGYQYGFWDRCGGSHHQHDCSGYMCWGGNMVGLNFGCTSSFALAIRCHQLGLGISFDEAQQTAGTWAFRGANEGQTSGGARNGSDGHIVCSDGRGGTLEAMGHAYGVRRGRFDYTRKFTYFAKVPGLTYIVAPEDQVSLFVCPNKPVKGDQIPHAEFRPAGFDPDYPNGVILLRNGASVNNDLPLSAGVRFIVPTGGKWTGCGEREKNGLFIVNDQGKTSPPGSLAWS